MNCAEPLNPISMRKIIRNLCKYFWVLIVCIVLSLVISFFVGMKGDQNNDKLEEYTVTLGIRKTENYKSIEEKYYSRELQKQVLEESVKRTFQTTDVINDELKNSGYEKIMPTEIPTYSEYSASDNFITLKVNSINKSRALYILDLYQNEINALCQKIDSECYIERISQSSNAKIEENNSGTFKIIILLFVGGILGVMIIGFLVLLDDRIYTEKELKSCFSFNNLGNISPGGLQLNKIWAQSYFEVNNINSILFIEERSKQVPVNELRASLKGHKINVCSKRDCLYYRQILESDAVFICITLGKTKISEVRSMEADLNSLGYSINGYLTETFIKTSK